MSTIVHMAAQSDWERAQAEASYHVESLKSEEFIHFSTPVQVARVANAIYAGRTELLLLVVDETRLDAELKYEPPAGTYTPGDELFPHLYGPLNLDAVTGFVEFPPNPDGTFSLPKELK